MPKISLSQEFKNAADIILFEKQVMQNYDLHIVEEPDIHYCDWLPDRTQTEKLFKEKVKGKYPNCCFNHWVGLPTIKYEDGQSGPMPLNKYEQRILQYQQANKYYALNKCRGAGATEIKSVRWNGHKYSHFVIPGRKALVCAGTNQDLSNNILGRIKQLMDTHPEVYLIEPRSENPEFIVFKSGGMIISVPAAINAVRGPENVGDVDYEEASFWKLNDDKPVLKAGEPHVIKSGAHTNILTTPNGRRGFYWDNIFSTDPNLKTKYFKHVVNWREVVGIPEPDPNAILGLDVNDRDTIKKFYLHKYKVDRDYKKWFHEFFGNRDINEILDVAAPILDVNEIINTYNRDRPTYDQEFDNQFILSENTAFGAFSVEDFEPEELNPAKFE